MIAAADAADLPLEDLRGVVRLGLARGARLLTAGELVVARRIADLEGTHGRLYARLTTRVHDTFELASLAEVPGVPDAELAVSRLATLGLVDGLVPWPERARRLTVPELAAACRGLGLRRSGRKEALVERLRGHTGWHDGRWIRVRHRGLIARLERWAFLEPRPDRSRLVVERLGLVQWPDYALTTGTGLHDTRDALRRWEGLLADDLTVEHALAALSRGDHRAPGRLDLGRRLQRALRHAAHEQERAGEPEAAARMYGALVEAGARPAELAFRHARAVEAAGRPEEALRILEVARGHARPSERVAIARAGRRLARSLRRGWAPDRPLRRAPRRALRLREAPATGRPRWGSRALTVEHAVCHLLREQGRRALHVEGAVWSTLFALLFAEVYFLPVPGALPVRFLAGPLDLGTPGFRRSRADAVDAVLAAVDDGEAPARVLEADRRWRGRRLARARWDVADGPTLAEIARGVGAPTLRTILERLLEHGRRATRGLPDLVVLPGPEVRLDGALPSRLPSELVLAEVKGPTDAVRDDQAVWLDLLVRARAPVELWEVGPR